MKKLIFCALALLSAFGATVALSQGGALDTWSKVANDGASYTIPGPSLLRYGRPGKWVQVVVSGTSGTCNMAALGITKDPAPAQAKQCDRRNGPVLALDTAGGPTTHLYGLEINQASVAAANATAALKPGLAYSTLTGTISTPAGGNNRAVGFTVFTGNQDGSPSSLAEGAVRTLCNVTHYAPDDAIVHPGEPDITHWHVFFGNGAIDAYTNTDNIRKRGRPGDGLPRSSCVGGSVNLSAYWVPAMTVPSTKALVPVAKPILVYYKTDVWPYLKNNPALENLPLGLRMVTGDATRTSVDSSVFFLNCYDAGGSNVESARGTTGNTTLTQMANCNQAGDVLWIRFIFHQCWDGNLDSTNHRSHVIEAVNTGVGSARVFQCPVDHPYVLVGISEIAKYAANTAGGPGNWALASDAYLNVSGTAGLPRGLSGHADYMMGWDKTISDAFHQYCEREGRDCGSWGTGDGRGARAFQGNNEN